MAIIAMVWASPRAGDSSGTITSTETTTQVQPGSTGSTGSTASTGTTSPGSGTSSAAATGPLGFGPQAGPLTGGCDPALYPGGYSANFAVPAPCIQPTCTSVSPTTGNVVSGGCQGTPPAASTAPVITTRMATEAARVVAPVNPPHVEPGTVSYVHFPNNYWADAPTVNDSVTLLGVMIPLRWTPTSTSWSFGDGATAIGNGVPDADLGAPGAIEHSYARHGSYAVTTTTNYDLTFLVPGQAAQTIQLSSPPSPAVTLPVREIASLVTYVS